MRVLFVLQYPGYLRYFDSVLESLSQRGHDVAVAFDSPHKQPEGLLALDDIDGEIKMLGLVPRRLWAFLHCWTCTSLEKRCFKTSA